MPLRTIVFAEFRRLNLRAGYVWQAQHYLNLRCKLDNQYLSSFDSTIENLCKEGILKTYPSGSIIHYRLTEKGEAVIREG